MALCVQQHGVLERNLDYPVEKLHRNERHLKDKREANASMMERIRREFEQMDRERQENDRQVEELRAMADEVERNVRCCRYSVFPG